VCRKERKSRAKKRWWKNNPDYDNYRRDKIKAWAKTYPDYWRKYRREHPDYVKKDNKRRSVRSKKSGISAKQDEIRKISVEKLNRIQEITPDFSAKQDKINRRVNDILEYLLWKESSAKQNHID
jgi:septin family protein